MVWEIGAMLLSCTAAEPAPAVPTLPPAATITPTVAPTAAPEPTPTTAVPESQPAETLQHLHQTEFAGAGAIDFALGDSGALFVAFSRDNNVYVVRSADGGRTFGDPVVASDLSNVFVYPLERPAIAFGPDGRLHVAWSENSYPGRIWYTVSSDGGQTFAPSIPLSESGPETVLVRLLLKPDGAPIATWLQNSELHFTQAAGDGQSFTPEQMIDDQTCDCCHPEPLLLDDALLIAYRNLVVNDENRQIRDIYLVRSLDGGQTFAEPVLVSDAPWFIAACPFSGPSLAIDDAGTIFVSWMDGRNDTAGNLSQTDIWLATSPDGGLTFSPNRRLNPADNGYNNLPSLAFDPSGRLHVIWQAEEAERDMIYYTNSDDGGVSFTPAHILVNSDDFDGRRPTNASLHVDDQGMIYASWVDSQGGYLAAWHSTAEESE